MSHLLNNDIFSVNLGLYKFGISSDTIQLICWQIDWGQFECHLNGQNIYSKVDKIKTLENCMYGIIPRHV